MPQDIHQIKLIEPTDQEVATYRSLSGWAVVGAILGAISPLALVDPLLWGIPIVAFIVNCRALWIIKLNAPAMTGRKAALIGLWLAVLCAAAAPTDYFYYQWRIRNEAKQAARFWFESLANNQPEIAYELSLPPGQRHKFDAKLKELYKLSDKWREPFELYFSTEKSGGSLSLPPTLLKLGKDADVRFIRLLDHQIIETQDVIEQMYSLTYTDAGERKTLLFKIRLARMLTADGSVSWRLLDSQTGVDEKAKKP
jgi:hypothetical protein